MYDLQHTAPTNLALENILSVSTDYTNCTIIVSSFSTCYKMCINVQTELLL